jgi:hypothetical protein
MERDVSKNLLTMRPLFLPYGRNQMRLRRGLESDVSSSAEIWELIFGLLGDPKSGLVEVEKAMFQGVV